MSSILFVCRVTMRVAKIVVEIEAFFSVDDVKEHVETLHGTVRLIIVRVASFRRPIGIFSSTAFVSAIEMIVETEAFPVSGVQEHVEALHGIVRLIIVRVTPFRRPLGIFSSITFIVSAKQNVAWLSFNLPEALLHVRVSILAPRCFC